MRTIRKYLLLLCIFQINFLSAASQNLIQETLKQFYQNKKVLVTGGAGFIGSHIVEKLVSLGAHVAILDDFSTGKVSNLISFAQNLTIYHSDVRDYQSVYKALTERDIVFHLAAFISVPLSIAHPDECYAINVSGTENVLKGCKALGIKRFILSSSCAVYGNREGICTETDELNPMSPYAISKMRGEELCKFYTEKEKMDCVCLRYFNVFGDRQDPKGQYAAVVAKFTDSLLNKHPLTIFGTGFQTRDYVPVEKIVEANLVAGMYADTWHGETFNVATGESINLFQLIEKLEQKLKIKNSGINFQPARPGDILHVSAHCQKYLTFLNKSLKN